LCFLQNRSRGCRGVGRRASDIRGAFIFIDGIAGLAL
jgi:hypothetical protein